VIHALLDTHTLLGVGLGLLLAALVTVRFEK
jgi:hypothetical protein